MTQQQQQQQLKQQQQQQGWHQKQKQKRGRSVAAAGTEEGSGERPEEGAGAELSPQAAARWSAWDEAHEAAKAAAKRSDATGQLCCGLARAVRRSGVAKSHKTAAAAASRVCMRVCMYECMGSAAISVKRPVCRLKDVMT